MKHKRLKNYLKLGVLLLGILTIFQNCQKEDSFEKEFKNQTDYYRTVSLNQLPKLKPVIENLKTFNKSNTNVSARQGTTYLGVENVLVDEIIQITNEDNISNYTFGIDTDFENTGFIENLYLREIEQGYISYIIRYEPNMDWYNNNLYSFHGKHYLNMENYQGDITKYSLEGEVIWSTKQEYINNSNSTTARSAGEFVTVCFISTTPVCGCNTPEHEHDPIGEGCNCVVYETTEVCQSGWVSGGGSINDDSNNGSDPTSGGGTGDNNNEDCETSGTLVVDEQPISGIGTGCSNNEETGVNTPEKPPVEEDCNTSKEDLKKVFPNMTDANAELLASIINDKGQDFGINSDETLWHFLAQAGHETGGFNTLNVTESTNYSTASLLPDRYSRFTMDSTLAATDENKYYAPNYVHNSAGVANVGMCCNNGNGNVASGDGYKYRGRGLFQLTWKDNYTAFKTWYNNKYDPDIDPVTSPDIVSSNDTLAILSGLWYYKTRVIDDITGGIDSTTTVDKVTIKVNGKKKKGLADRKQRFQKAKDSINCL